MSKYHHAKNSTIEMGLNEEGILMLARATLKSHFNWRVKRVLFDFFATGPISSITHPAKLLGLIAFD